MNAMRLQRESTEELLSLDQDWGTEPPESLVDEFTGSFFENRPYPEED